MCMYGVRGCEIPGDYCVETVAFLVLRTLLYNECEVGSGCNQKGMGMAIRKIRE